MSTDARITADLIETLRDGEDGFTTVADLMDSADKPGLAPTFREMASQRSAFADELEQLAAAYGDDIDEDGSAVAAVHRAWLKVKDTLTGSDPAAILRAAETGEEYAVNEYTKALGADISDNLRTVIARQMEDVLAAQARVKQLEEAL